MSRRPFASAVCLPGPMVLLLAAMAAVGPAAAGQVYVEDSPGAQDALAAARDRLGKGEAEVAARRVQSVLSKHGRKLLATEEDRFVEARQVAEQLLLEHPKLLKAYRRTRQPKARRLLEEAGSDRTKLTRIVRRYGLTDAGRRAALRLAGLELEAGRAAQARILLRRIAGHPTLDAQRRLWRRLMAAASLIGGDRQRYERFRGELADSGADGAVKQLEALAASLQPRRGVRTLNPLDSLPAAAPPEQTDEPLWQRSIGGIQQYLIDVHEADPEEVREVAGDGRYLNVMPAVRNSVVYVNDGTHVRALDASSGLELWTRRVFEPRKGLSIRYASQARRWLPSGIDLSTVAVSRHRVAAITGFGSMVTLYPHHGGNERSQLACLDRETGRVLWTRRPGQVDEDLAEAFWYGRPIIRRGRLYVTVRRRQRTRFQDAYLLALDLESGDLVWRRHLASSALLEEAGHGATRSKPVPTLSHIKPADGWLYVDTRLGTVAKVSAASGRIAWLRRLSMDQQLRRPRTYRPWQAGAPLLLEAGLVTFDDWSGLVRVFDPKTGEQRRTISATEWGSPTYLAPIGRDLLAVGSEIGRYDGRTLEAEWTHKTDGKLRGRAGVTASHVYAPIDRSVRVLDAETGQQRTKMEAELPANVLALDGQLVLARSGTLRSYSSWAVASRRLQRRIERRPKDPRPLVAMAWLALRNGRGGKLMRSLDRAIRLQQKLDDRKLGQSLFDHVLAMVRAEADLGSEVRDKLFDRLATVAASPDQEVTYRLVLARHNERSGQLRQAVEHYQNILSDRAQRRRLYHHEDGARQAGLEARHRLESLLAKHGRKLYQRYEAYAQDRLAQLKQGGSPERLVRLAESHPLATVSTEALRIAAERAERQGRLEYAAELLRRAIEATTESEQLARLYGRRVQLLLKQDRPGRAQRVLRTIAAAHPKLRPIRDGSPTPVKDWLDRIESVAAGRGAGASITLPLSKRVRALRGELLTPAHGATVGGRPPGLVLATDGGRLAFRRAKDLAIVWTRQLDLQDPRLLTMDRRRMWLWSPKQQRVQVRTLGDGALAWQRKDVGRLLKQIEIAGHDEPQTEQEAAFRRMIVNGRIVMHRRNRQQQQQQEAAEAARMHVAVTQRSLALADRRGRLIVLDGEGGRVRWQTATPVRRVKHLAMGAGRLVIGGQDGRGTTVLCVYDVRNGDRRHRIGDSELKELRWMTISPRGLLLYATSSRIKAFDLHRGAPRWIATPEAEFADAPPAGYSARRLVIGTKAGDLLWVDLDDGRVRNRLVVRGSIQGPLRLRSDARSWFIIGRNRGMAVGPEGEVRWRDAVQEPARLLDARLTESHLLVLARRIDKRQQTPRRHLYALDRRTGSLKHHQALQSPMALDRMRVLSNRLLIWGEGMTAVLRSRE